VETYFMVENTQKPARDTTTSDELPEAGPSRIQGDGENGEHSSSGEENGEEDEINASPDDLVEGMNLEGFVGERILKPLTPEALAAFQAAQNRAGVIYISRIPPGMRPTKVRHLMSAHGDIGRVYLQQEGMSCSITRTRLIIL
jgi:ESF2/ABP1 family protein